MGYKVDVDVTNNADQVREELETKMQVALESLGLAGESFAKQEITAAVYDTPESRSGYVRTGRLRNSISHASDGEAAYIGTNVEYAAYVEMGTSRMIARPYLKPAVQNYIEEYKNIVDKVMRS